MINIIGDSSAGKTQLCYSTLAEACMNPLFDDYELIYDGSEARDFFDIEKLYGKKLKDRMLGSTGEKNKKYSESTEEWEVNVHKALKRGNCIYILDSADALCPPDAEEQIKKKIKHVETGAKVSGSYGMTKAKSFSESLQRICGMLEKTSSILIIVSQTRENIDPGSFQKKTRACGKALKFYACHEMWLAVSETIKKDVKGKKVIIGQKVAVKVSKNNLTGKQRVIEFPVYYDYGIDDIGSCIDYLLDIGDISKSSNSINIELLDEDVSGTRDTVIRKLEQDEDLIKALQHKTMESWKNFESALSLDRVKKYE